MEEQILKRFGIEDGKFTEDKYDAFWYWITPPTNNPFGYPVYLIMSLKDYTVEEILEKVRLNFPSLYNRLPVNEPIDEFICRKSYLDLRDRWNESYIIKSTILFLGKNGENYLPIKK